MNIPPLFLTLSSAGLFCLALGQEPAADQPGVAPPLFLPWLAGERVPVDDNRLRGAFLGLSLQHGRASLRQAVIEVSRQLAQARDARAGWVKAPARAPSRSCSNAPMRWRAS